MVLPSFSLGLGNLRLLNRGSRSLSLQRQRSDNSLHLLRLGFLLSSGGFKLSSHGVDVRKDRVFLGQRKQLADLRRSLRTAHSRHFGVGQARHVRVALLDDGDVQHRNVLRNDAPSARFSATLAFSSAVALEALRASDLQEKDALVRQHALLHPEALLVVTAHDFKDVSLPFVAQRIGFDFGGDALIVENAELVFIRDFNLLLAASGRVRDVELCFVEEEEEEKKEKRSVMRSQKR